jgi:hypothetical protein
MLVGNLLQFSCQGILQRDKFYFTLVSNMGYFIHRYSPLILANHLLIKIHIFFFLFLGLNTPNDCLESGKEYEGTRDYTINGVKCQAWGSNTPHEISSGERHCERRVKEAILHVHYS